MKFTKFIPLVFALALAVPAFAEGEVGSNATSTMIIGVDEYINITTEDLTLNSTATPTEDYASLNLDPTLAATFHVVTNHPGDHVYLTATTLADSNAVNALCAGSAANKYYLVFGKQAAVSDVKFDTATAAVQNITNGSPAVASNANAIAFEVTPSYQRSGAAAADPSPAAITNAGVVAYDIDNGIYDMTYTLANSPVATTFSTHDTNGTYQAILKLSHTNP